MALWISQPGTVKVLVVVDVGLSMFNGTNREPFLMPGADRSGAPVLVQHYDQIRQFGLDAQLTVGSWLFKFEAIQRAGARNLLGMEEDYVASVFWRRIHVLFRIWFGC